MIALARKTLVHEWRRFIPSVFAVGFSGVLLAMQAALVLGIFGSAAVYVTASSADIWVGYPGTQSVNFGRNIGSDVEMRVRMDPDVAAVGRDDRRHRADGVRGSGLTADTVDQPDRRRTSSVDDHGPVGVVADRPQPLDHDRQRADQPADIDRRARGGHPQPHPSLLPPASC